MNDERRNHLTVAILLENLAVVREISKIFKKTGVSPCYYQDLPSFWNETLLDIPSLCVVDVKMMSNQRLMLKNHPHVKTGQIPFLFYYTDETLPLLDSTYEIYNYGLIRESSDYQGQIKAALSRFNKVAALEREVRNLSKEKQQIDNQLSSMASTIEKQKIQNHLTEVLQNLGKCLNLTDQEEDFSTAVVKVFGEQSFIDKISMMGPDATGKKLISPIVSHVKYHHFPSLWPGQIEDGIEFFAQNMANQVALDVLGENLVLLLVRNFNKVRKMIFLQVNDPDFLSKFDWESLELLLAGIHTRFQLRAEKLQEKSIGILSPWELMSILDEFFYQKPPADFRKTEIKEHFDLVDLDFSRLISFIQKKKDIRFYWKRFFHVFLSRMQAGFQGELRLSCMGVRQIGFLVDKKRKEDFYPYLKSYASKFSYWRYFSDNDLVLAKDVGPIVSIMPFSSDAYLMQQKKAIHPLTFNEIQENNSHEESDKTPNQFKHPGAELSSS